MKEKEAEEKGKNVEGRSYVERIVYLVVIWLV